MVENTSQLVVLALGQHLIPKLQEVTLLVDINTLLPTLGASGVLTLIVSGLYNYWVSRNLETFKAQLQADNTAQLVQIQAASTMLLSQKSKIQEREFVILIEVWNMLQHAYGATTDLVQPVHEFSDIRKNSDELVITILTDQQFTIDEQSAILELQGDARQNRYQDRIIWHKLDTAEQRVRDWTNHVLLTYIFLPPLVEELCFQLAELLRNTLSDYRAGLQSSDGLLQQKAQTDLRPKADEIIRKIAEAIRKQLYPI